MKIHQLNRPCLLLGQLEGQLSGLHRIRARYNSAHKLPPTSATFFSKFIACVDLKILFILPYHTFFSYVLSREKSLCSSFLSDS